MGQYTSYYLYQKYEQRGEQEAIPVYPNVYSIDADGTRERVVKIQDDPQCGYDPPIKPIYKWINMPITQDYICDDCPAYQTRWVRTDETICSGTPTPVSKKLVATYTGSITNEVDCNSSTELTTGETKPSGYEYSAMTSAVIGDCVTTIGEEAFRLCRSLTSVTIPNSVTTIGVGAFQTCSGLTSVIIPNSVASINQWVFYYCTSLTSVTIPNSVTSIDLYAFYHCDSLTSIDIPNSVTSIGEQVFGYCSGLTSVTIEATTPPTLGSNAFRNTPIASGTGTIYVPASSVSAYKSASGWSEYASRIQPIP